MWQMICVQTCNQGVPGFLGTDWSELRGEQGERGATGAGATGATGCQRRIHF